MTNANRKRFKRGDPLLYKCKPERSSLRNILALCKVDNKYYSLYNDNKIHSNEVHIFKRFYLAAVRSARKKDRNISFDSNKIAIKFRDIADETKGTYSFI